MGEEGSTAGCSAIGWVDGYRRWWWCMISFCSQASMGGGGGAILGFYCIVFKSSCLVFVLSEGHVTCVVFRLIILSPAVLSAFYFCICC